VEDPDYYCMAKVLTKGSAYLSTDTGNHWGATPGRTGNPDLFRACREYMKDKNNHGLPNPYFPTNLSLVHMQDLTFHDWVVHHMRGASSYGYNKLGLPMRKMNCKDKKGSHYCRTWIAMGKAGFNYWQMKGIFQEQKCSSPEDRKVSIAEVFPPSLCA
jgi:hypothetical protein